ncbi:MAG: carboxylating nicotinate-nucleotide diphosphorylase [Chloroflexi bacterium]|nr:carboxylating nicotinate-nucleotide diphosphorylase [Chloroflexota bacterium]
MPLLGPAVDSIINAAILEDLGWGDVTTEILVPPELQAQGSFLMKSDGVLAGMEVAAAIFKRVDPGLAFDAQKRDGDRVKKGDVIGSVSGSAASILKAERTALNFLQRLSGTATMTAHFIDLLKGLPTRVAETRKTTPGLRYLEKYAVRVGGGVNHRHHLGDGILIKDNHMAALNRAGLTLPDIIKRAKDKSPHTLKVEIEVTTVADAVTAAEAGADIILLDNMAPPEMRKAVKAVAGRAMLEASGGISLDNARTIAETGVNIISVGALTHSARALDISLELEYAR